MKNAQQQQTIITKECSECGKTFRDFANSKMKFCSFRCKEDYQFMLELDEHYSKNTKIGAKND